MESNIEKAKKLIQQALELLGSAEPQEDDEDAADGGADDDEEGDENMGAKMLAMKMKKYT